MVSQLATRLVSTDETVEVNLARGKLDGANKLAESGLWSRNLETLETMTPLPNPKDDAYRLYNVGVANEALGYQSEDRAAAKKFLEQAAINYGKAIDAKPDEQLFLEPHRQLLHRGLEQRVTAINAYVKDIYGRRDIIKAGVIPEDLIFQNPQFRPEMNGQTVPHNIYVHIAGIDIVRVDPKTFYVLEDNVRIPSGVSYMLENREIMLRLFPELFSRYRVAPVENYPEELLDTL